MNLFFASVQSCFFSTLLFLRLNLVSFYGLDSKKICLPRKSYKMAKDCYYNVFTSLLMICDNRNKILFENMEHNFSLAIDVTLIFEMKSM